MVRWNCGKRENKEQEEGKNRTMRGRRQKEEVNVQRHTLNPCPHSDVEDHTQAFTGSELLVPQWGCEKGLSPDQMGMKRCLRHHNQQLALPLPHQ